MYFPVDFYHVKWFVCNKLIDNNYKYVGGLHNFHISHDSWLALPTGYIKKLTLLF